MVRTQSNPTIKPLTTVRKQVIVPARIEPWRIKRFLLDIKDLQGFLRQVKKFSKIKVNMARLQLMKKLIEKGMSEAQREYWSGNCRGFAEKFKEAERQSRMAWTRSKRIGVFGKFILPEDIKKVSLELVVVCEKLNFYLVQKIVTQFKTFQKELLNNGPKSNDINLALNKLEIFERMFLICQEKANELEVLLREFDKSISKF